MEKENPGKVTNEKLLKRFEKYLRDDDPNDSTNFVLKNKMREGIDYKLMPKSCWDVLENRFGGLEIKRKKDSDSFARSF